MTPRFAGLVAPFVHASAPDAVLLTKFTQDHDRAAFAELYRRHNPMVLGVCRRVLDHAQDAEDAFQATFLVLSRKAASVEKKESLGSWLYGVAYCVARVARRRRDRARRASDDPTRGRAAGSPLDDLTMREAGAVLYEELYRLRDTLRAPLVLCYLEGRTYDEAARQLGCTLGALKGRLETGRARLKLRLARRGIELGGLLGMVSLKEAARAGTPPGLRQATLENVLAERFGGPVSVIDLAAPFLTRGVGLRLPILAVTTVASLTLVVGAGVLAFPARDADPARAPAEARAVESAPPAHAPGELAAAPRPPAARAAAGQFVSPRAGDILTNKDIPVRVKLDHLPPLFSVFVCTRRDDDLELWPKPLVWQPEGEYLVTTVCEAGAPPRVPFRLALVAVDSRDREAIGRWFDTEVRPEHVPPFRLDRIPSARFLHEITVELDP